MRLIKLHVRGFKRLRDVDLDLDHDRLLVIGVNEAGKSTLMSALVTGLYGLAPARRGSGHTAALRQVLPWSGEAAGLNLIYDLDDGRRIEVDWNLSGQRTQVVDRSCGEDISATFGTGTHGWLDVGESLLHMPAGVFAQVTCVAEGELAGIADGVEVRQSLLRVSDSGVDVLVEEAIRRLDEAARQASIPKVNAATRRNEVAQQLEAAEAQLAGAQEARLALESEIDAIGRSEAALESARRQIAAIGVEEDRRLKTRSRLGGEIDRARGRLQEAELRLASLQQDGRGNQTRQQWSDVELERARERLVAGTESGRRATPPVIVLATIGAGVAGLVVGIASHLVLFELLGAVLVAAGVYLVTRGKPAGHEDLAVGGARFASRVELMAAMDQERTRRDHQQQLAAVAGLQDRLNRLLQPSTSQTKAPGAAGAALLAELSDEELERRSQGARERLDGVAMELARQRASLERGARMIPEVSPLEERVRELRQNAAHLDAFGDACRMASVSLAEASEEIRRAYAPRLQSYLGRNLARVTEGRYVEALVSEKFEVLLRAPETMSMVDLRQLSRGTQQQVYLLLRLGLLEAMGSSTETLPLFLDDALALADDQRRSALLKVLDGEQRQVIYLTGGESAAAGFGPNWKRLILPPPAGPEVGALPAEAARVTVVVDRSAWSASPVQVNRRRESRPG